MEEEPAYTLEIKVHAGSSRRAVELHDDGVHIHTTFPPLEGKANRDIIKLISDSLDIPKQDIVLFRGEKSKHKVFLIAKRAVDRIKERSRNSNRTANPSGSEILNHLKARYGWKK